VISNRRAHNPTANDNEFIHVLPPKELDRFQPGSFLSNFNGKSKYSRQFTEAC
jgi:hypothetical protein